MINKGCKKYRREGDKTSNIRRMVPLIDCEREIPVAARKVVRNAVRLKPVAARRVVRKAVKENPVSCRSLDRGDSSLGDAELYIEVAMPLFPYKDLCSFHIVVVEGWCITDNDDTFFI